MRVLIVEDEQHLAAALCEILKKHKYTADMVHDGISGLDYAVSGIYDVIILDIMLPGLNGIQILKGIRDEGLSVPVLLLTAKDEVSDKVTGLDSGADDYLTKPFAMDELLARLRALTRRKGEVQDDNLTFGDIALNLSTGELICGSNSLKLGLKELQIMELLLANGKRIVTKESFIEKIWGFESEAEYNNVEVYISFIRKKLQHLKSKTEVKTSRGIGYFLEEA